MGIVPIFFNYFMVFFFLEGDCMLTDTHCHVYNEYYDDIDEIIKKSEENGVKRFINNACNLETSLEVLELSNKYKNMFCAIGLHPTENLFEIDNIEELIRKNVNNNKLVAIGEIGLDYYWNKDNKIKQKEVFIRQLDIAQEFNLPVIIHSRDAIGDVLEVLKNYNLKGVIHSFSGSVDSAKEFIKLGYKLGINGVVTFKNCKLIDVIKELGVDNLVFETDCPYLTPQPDRGKKNDPSYIHNIVDFIANNLSISSDLLERISNKNINDIFDI